MMLFCSQGIRKCVPSPMTLSCTPVKRSKMTARDPPLTSYMDASISMAAATGGKAHRRRAFVMFKYSVVDLVGSLIRPVSTA